MWIMTSNSFLSIVAAKKRDFLLVRARRPGDIERHFPKAKVHEWTGTDYRFRAIIPRQIVETEVAEVAARINYDNFKNSVMDDDLHDALMKVWTAMYGMQEPNPRWNNRPGLQSHDLFPYGQVGGPYETIEEFDDDNRFDD